MTELIRSRNCYLELLDKMSTPHWEIPDSQPPSPQAAPPAQPSPPAQLLGPASPPPSPSESPSPVNTHDNNNGEFPLVFKHVFLERHPTDRSIGWIAYKNQQDIVWSLDKDDPDELIEMCTAIAKSPDGTSISNNIRNARGPYTGSYHIWRVFVSGSEKFAKRRERWISPPEDNVQAMFREFLIEASNVSEDEYAGVTFLTKLGPNEVPAFEEDEFLPNSPPSPEV